MEAAQDRLLDLSLRLLRPDWPWPVRYGLAVVFTLAVAGLKLAIPAFGTPGPDLFLTIPVAASAVLAGLGPALVAIIGTTLIAAYFTPPAGFAFSLNGNGLDVIGFFFEGLVIAILGAAVRAAFTRTAESLRRREQLEQERTALIATVNHELRNPLASLSGHLQLASRYAAREDMRDRVPASIDEAKRQVGRLVRLADDLQVISTRVADFRVEPEAFDVVAAARLQPARVRDRDHGRCRSRSRRHPGARSRSGDRLSGPRADIRALRPRRRGRGSPRHGDRVVRQQGDRDAHGGPPLRRGQLACRIDLRGGAAARRMVRR